MQADRSHSDGLKAERDRLIQSREALASRCQQLEEEAARLQQMLATRNSALSEELGLQAAYSKALAELSGQCLSAISMKTSGRLSTAAVAPAAFRSTC